jgi:death-on-curing family protein
VIRLHRALIIDAPPTQPSLLDSAVQSPINIKYYTNEKNIFLLAANLSERIMKNHAFQDGNKRTALAAVDMFLRINGYQLQTQDLKTAELLESAHVAVCTNAMTAEQLALLYQRNSTKIEEWTPEIIAYRNGATEH